MPSEWENNSSSSSAKVSSSSASSLSASSSTATSPEPNTNGNNSNNNSNNDSAKNGHEKDGAIKSSIMSHDPTSYVARARVTRPTPPKPSCNPMQFVQIKPCNLYQSAQQQLKKAEEIKKVKEVLKEEPEDWQNNLDNWKSSRRKRVEHIIDRVVEVKKLEQEEHDRTRRKSKTFSEMMEERGERGRARPKLQSLASYNEDETNDLSDLGIGTSSASGKSSISEDCEVNSIVSEPPETENISSFHLENNSCLPCHDSNNRDRISSPGYETSSTAPVASPDPYEYTYEGAIEDYKSRVSKASASSIYNKPSFTGSSVMRNSVFDRKPISIDSENDAETSVSTIKKDDLPKIDISKKRELFEKPEITKKPVSPSCMQNQDQIEKKRIPSEFANVRSIKDRLCSLEKKSESADEPTTGILSGEICSIKERLQCLEQQKQQNSVNPKPNTNKVVAEVVAVPPLKDRLSSLQNAVTKEEVVKKPIVLVDEYQLEMLKNEELARRQLDTIKDGSVEKAPSDDSGINTTDEKIDHEPATTTEDEDDDEEIAHEEETIQLYEEKLKNVNPSTVVSLVEKPVVSDVGGGNALFDSGKDYRTDQDGEVNHAQNLLKMFKMAFKDDAVDEKPTSESVKANIVDQNRKEELGLVKTKENQANSQAARVPWRRVRESSESEVKISKIPQPKISNTIEDNTKTSVVQSSKIPQSSSTVQNISSTVESDVGISINPQKSVGITEFGKKPVDNSSKVTSFKKVESIEEILGEDSATVVVDTSPKVVTPEVETEIIPSSSRYGAKPHDLVQNLILNIDNSQKKSMIPIPSKIQSSNPKPDVQSPKFETHKIPTPVTPKTPTSAVGSPQNSPVYENAPHDIDISHPSCVGLKPVCSPQNHGRVEIFNSRSMPEKPKSPEVLPKGIKTSPNESMTSEVQSKDFQQSAMDGFIKDLESWQPKIVGEQPKQIYEITPTKIVSEKPIEVPEIVKDTVEVGKTTMDSKGRLIDSVISSTPIPLEKEIPALNNLQTQSISKLTELASDKDTKSSEPTKTAEKSIANQSRPLPFESCVDILQSFLAAERSYPEMQGHSSNEPQLAKKSNRGNSAVSEGFLRQETVVEVPCSKIDVKDLPDPNFIKTPCIDVDCGEKFKRGSTISSQAQVRDSLSSAGDSSPSSEITVIFKPKGDSNPTPDSQNCPIMDVSKTVDPSTAGSPKPNPSSLLQIANRVNSPIAGRRNLPPTKKKTVCEEPCLKLNVNDLPDPNFIRTPCIEVDKSSLSQCGAAPRPNSPSSPQTPVSQLHKANAEVLKKTCDDLANSPPLSPVLGGSPSGDKPNFLIARVEVVETKIKVTTTNDTETPPAVPVSAPPQALPGSPKLKPKSVENLKPKNIFEFIKKNFQSKPEVTETPSESDEFEPISVDNSKFYVPSDVPSSSSSSNNGGTSGKDSTASDVQGNNGVNIEIIKTITTDSIVEQTDAELNLTNEIDEILDEEISKLVVEDAKL